MKQNRQIRNSGFTLLETSLAMSILVIMISIIFSITQSSVSLSQNMLDVQSNARRQSAVYNYLKNLFANLPTDARFTLEYYERDLQTLTIEYPNTEFPASGRQRLAKTMWIATLDDKDGLKSLIMEVSDQLVDENTGDEPIYFQADLIESMTSFRWEFYYPVRDEWSPEWVPSMGRPKQIKLFYTYPQDEQENTHYFWIPQQKNPKLNIQPPPTPAN